MSDTNIFKCSDAMVSPDGDGVVRPTHTLSEAQKYGGLPLLGYRKNPMDVINTHAGRPSPTGRRP